MASDHYPAVNIGGAMSVKLVSWSEPLKITANHPDVVERNARYFGRLYHEAKVKEPPIMEWTFLANVMQAYTVLDPLPPGALQHQGVEGIMDSCYLAPATIADGAGAVGKWQCPVMVHGFVMTWRSSPTEYDTNREYGLNLPRQVVSNKFTRDLQIDGMDIFDIRLAQDPYLWDNRYTAIKELAKATEGPVRSLEEFWQILSTPLTQQFERTTQARFLEECKLDNYKVNTINNWVSQRVGKDKMAQVRLAVVDQEHSSTAEIQLSTIAFAIR
ncbi:AMY1.1 [Symbiodinium microadriaticum]|nr:AMY1.1 [Symbiodinium microadriaticum]